MRRPTILLADDHVLLAQALEHLLQSEFDVVGTVADGRALLKAAGELLPDVVVVDIAMPLLNGLDAAEQLKALYRNVKVIVLTQNREPRFAVEVPAPCVGVLTEGRRRVGTDDRDPRSPSWQVLCLASNRQGHGRRDGKPTRGLTELRDLSAREREVLQLLAEGKSMKEVAALLDISPRTVEFHK